MRTARGFVLVAVSASLAFLQPAMAVAQRAPTSEGSTSELERLVNLARVQAGRLPLADAPELDAAAQAHSLDMVEHDYLDHVGSDGSQPQERAIQAGYEVPPDTGWIVVEVISAISADPAGPVSWWLNEDPAVHGKVLLDPRWREIGAGYARGGQYGNYWTVLVGCRPGVLPLVVFEGLSYQHTEQCNPSTSVAGVIVRPTRVAGAPLRQTAVPY